MEYAYAIQHNPLLYSCGHCNFQTDNYDAVLEHIRKSDCNPHLKKAQDYIKNVR